MHLTDALLGHKVYTYVLQKSESRMSGNNVLTHLSGEERDNGKLWDLGLGYESFEACIL
jgi:hypothetical protein